MAEVITQEFFAPVRYDALSALVAEYAALRKRVEDFHQQYKVGDLRTPISYFCMTHGAQYPDFRLENAVCALNAQYWKAALDLTDVYDLMPAKRREEWNDQLTAWRERRYVYGQNPEKDLPDFTEENLRSVLESLLLSRSQFFAERVDGIFRGLSRQHVTNSPQAFNKRMIINRVITDGWYVEHGKAWLLNDLRMVINKILGRGSQPVDDSEQLVKLGMKRPGKWLRVDGGVLRVRVYAGAGTVHLEVHPEVSWRLNQVLSMLYPAAIPESLRHKPVRERKIKDFELVEHVLPGAVVAALQRLEQARELNPKRHEFRQNTFTMVPNALAWRGDAPKDTRVLEMVEAVLTALGATRVGRGKAGFYYQFDYDAELAVKEVCVCGGLPDEKSHQYYPTPASLAEEVVLLAEPGTDGTSLWLEPSAGTGNLARLMPAGQTTCVEASPTFYKVLKAQGHWDVLCLDFLQYTPRRPVDRVVMNPPFSQGRWQSHVKHAASMLAPGGRLVAIVPASAKDKFELDGLICRYSDARENQFPGVSVSVVILTADKI